MDIIVGAGITGLSYAANTKNDYIIIEKEDSPGGYCKTIKQDGFIWDYSGHFFHFQDDTIKSEVMKNIPADEILYVNKQTQIKYKDRLINYPFQKNIHQLPQEEFIDCLFDLFNNPFQNESSFKEMLYKKFGKAISEKFLIPYNEKLYACDLDTLDVDAMGRFFPYADKEQIIANFRSNKEDSYNSFFLYPKGGAIEYIKSICKYVDINRISLNERIISIDRKKKQITTNKRVLKYDNLISTIPFPQLLTLSGISFDPSIYTCNKVLVFNIGFDKKGNDQVNHWIYFPEDKYSFYRVGFYDNIFSSNRLSIYVEIGLNQQDKVDINSAYQRVLSDLKISGIISDHKVVSKCSIIMNPAYVHINSVMEEDKRLKMNYLADNSIFSIGRYGGWMYCSMEDNIKQAKELANKLS